MKAQAQAARTHYARGGCNIEYDITDYLSNVNARIFDRGVVYYESGMINSLRKNGNRYTARVSGSEHRSYTVEITMAQNGAVESFACDCPYDRGGVCKHIVAVLLAVSRKDYTEDRSATEKTPSNGKQAVPMEELFARATKEELVALVLRYAEVDEVFRYEALSAVGAPAEQELTAAKEFIKDSIRRNTSRGYIDYRGCDNICGDMDTVLGNARRRSERGQCAEALALALSMLLIGVRLASQADSSSGALSYTMDNAHQIIKENAIALCKGSHSVAQKRDAFDSILKTARNKAFDGWEDWRHELLRSAAPLCDQKSAAKLAAYLDSMLAKRRPADHDYYLVEDMETRFCLKRAIEGRDAARAYLDGQLDIDRARELAVYEDISDEKYENAERLCLEKAREDTRASYARPSKWNYLLYEIYLDSRQREKQIAQAQRLLLLGDMDFSDKLKCLLLKDGRWETEYPKLLEKLKASLSHYEYMKILEKEGETALLMEQLRLHPELAFEYGKLLSGTYGDELHQMCEAIIRHDAASASDRNGYHRLCASIVALDGFGANTRALSLIEELRKANPRRPAMLDELNMAARKIRKDEVKR